MADFFTDKRFLDVEAALTDAYKAWKERGNIEEAEEKYLSGWKRISEVDVPELQHEYDYLRQTTPWKLVKFYRDTGQFQKSHAWVQVLREIYGNGVAANSSIDFLEATVYYESDDLQKAYEIFHSLYKDWGRRPFSGEDKKYLEFCLNQGVKKQDKTKTEGLCVVKSTHRFF